MKNQNNLLKEEQEDKQNLFPCSLNIIITNE